MYYYVLPRWFRGSPEVIPLWSRDRKDNERKLLAEHDLSGMVRYSLENDSGMIRLCLGNERGIERK